METIFILFIYSGSFIAAIYKSIGYDSVMATILAIALGAGIVFLLAAILAKENYITISGIKLNINNLIGTLLIGLLFLKANYFNDLFARIDFPLWALSLVSAIIGFLMWFGASKSKHYFFYETVVLVLVPGVCWFSRLVDNNGGILVSVGMLAGALSALSLACEWTKTHPSATLLQNPEILMYRRTLRFQDFLRLAYGQLFVHSRGFRSGTSLSKKSF